MPSCGHSSLILKATLLQRLFLHQGAFLALHSINLLLLSLQARPLLLLLLPGLVLLGGQDGLLDDCVGQLRGEERDILCKQPERAATLGERDVRQAALALGEEALGSAVPGQAGREGGGGSYRYTTPTRRDNWRQIITCVKEN